MASSLFLPLPADQALAPGQFDQLLNTPGPALLALGWVELRRAAVRADVTDHVTWFHPFSMLG